MISFFNQTNSLKSINFISFNIISSFTNFIYFLINVNVGAWIKANSLGHLGPERGSIINIFTRKTQTFNKAISTFGN